MKKTILILIYTLLLNSCADYNVSKTKKDKEKLYFSSKGFALIYEDSLYKQKVIRKKISNGNIQVMHNSLKVNTPVKIINPENSKIIETIIYKKTNYPIIFNAVISEKIATILELDSDNPYIELIEMKKNKKFIAKESNTFEEEKNVAEKAPVNEIEMDDLTLEKSKVEKKKLKRKKFILVVNDFYFEDSANNLKINLVEKTKMNNFSVKKINNNKYRLLVGPFENFNALKDTYISLNNLGFGNLDIYRE